MGGRLVVSVRCSRHRIEVWGLRSRLRATDVLWRGEREAFWAEREAPSMRRWDEVSGTACDGGEDAAWRVDLAELLVPAGNR